jgi:hypothetical protein
MSIVMSAGEAHYTRSEVIWLLGMARQHAIDADASAPSFLGNVSAEGPQPGGAGEDQLPVIARWHDVQRAKRRVLARLSVAGARQELIIRLRATGYSEEVAARIVSVSRSSARRGQASMIDAVLAELGGEAPERRGQRAPMCAKCHTRPAAKSRLLPPRQLSLCEGCIPIAIARRLLSRYDRYAATR